MNISVESWTNPNGGDSTSTLHGLTLRDIFAGLAMQGLLANSDPCEHMSKEETAQAAYAQADAMLAAREEGK